jgi:formamidopyrimidine-DNA glycosylase
VKRAYNVGGATIATFKDMYGNSGKFFDQFQIYGKKIDPLGNLVSRELTKDGRSTYYVKGIQL